MKKAYSVKNVITAKFRTLKFTGRWKAGIGCPELTGSWIIYGAPKNGKTSLAMQLSKYLTEFGRVAYNSVEEGLSLTMQSAIERAGIVEVENRWNLLDKEDIANLIPRLQKQRSADVVIIDSVQFLELKFSEYKKLKETFPDKLFIYISHVDGQTPEGNTARRIWRDANVVFRVEGFKAFIKGRYGGGAPIIISEPKAIEYWGDRIDDIK